MGREQEDGKKTRGWEENEKMGREIEDEKIYTKLSQKWSKVHFRENVMRDRKQNTKELTEIEKTQFGESNIMKEWNE